MFCNWVSHCFEKSETKLPVMAAFCSIIQEQLAALAERKEELKEEVASSQLQTEQWKEKYRYAMCTRAVNPFVYTSKCI